MKSKQKLTALLLAGCLLLAGTGCNGEASARKAKADCIRFGQFHLLRQFGAARERLGRVILHFHTAGRGRRHFFGT